MNIFKYYIIICLISIIDGCTMKANDHRKKTINQLKLRMTNFEAWSNANHGHCQLD